MGHGHRVMDMSYNKLNYIKPPITDQTLQYKKNLKWNNELQPDDGHVLPILITVVTH